MILGNQRDLLAFLFYIDFGVFSGWMAYGEVLHSISDCGGYVRHDRDNRSPLWQVAAEKYVAEISI